MTFSSISFIVFFIAVMALMWVTRIPVIVKTVDKDALRKARHIVLLIASYIFYGWWDWRFCFLMFALSLIAFVSSLKIEKNEHKKFYTFVGIAFPLIVLGFFKYFNFFLGSFAALFNITNLHALGIILPVGISFYTFQSMSYTLDVYRGKMKAGDSFVEFALYVSFFPQLVAGPIVKASDFMPQLKEYRNVSLPNMELGLQIFLFGLVKKIVIADHLSVFVDSVFAAPLAFSSLTVILGVAAYSIQIYFDFSGYSDMAVGCAKCLGYDLQRNFNIPYISRNVSEFWKRWHISLSTWLQEYLYFSLGGNRRGTARTYINLMITMVLGGLWHGASWNFVFWGALHGIALCAHKAYCQFVKPAFGNGKSNMVTTVVSVLLTYCYVCVCWVFFRSADFRTSWDILYRIFVWNSGVNYVFTWVLVGLVLLLAATAAACIRSVRGGMAERSDNAKTSFISGFYPVLNLNKTWALVIVFFVAGLSLGFAFTGNNPFIYFQF